MTQEINPALMPALAGDSGLWLGSLASYFSAQARMASAQSLDAATLKLYSDYGDEDEDEDRFGAYSYMVQDLADGIVGVHIRGTLITENSYWNRYFGEVSYEEIINALTVAADQNPSDIVLMVKSPGGAAQGISEASDHINMIQNSGINVTTHTGSIMASGGYWLGVNGKPIWASGMAEVGSVGVISVHMEYTKMMERIGVKPTVMRTSEFKALGTPYEKFDQKAHDEHMRRMEEMHSLFVSHIAAKRGMVESSVSANIATGQVFLGQEALQLGAIDRVGTLEELVQHLSEGRNATHSMTTNGEDPMKRRILSDGQQAQLDAAVAAGADPEQALASLDANGDDGENSTEGNDGKAESSGDEESTETTAEDKTEDKGEAAGDGDGEGAEGEGGESVSSQTGADSAAVAALSAQVEGLQQKVVDLSVENSKLKTDAANAGAALPALTKLAANVLGRMEVGLGRAITPTEGMSAQALAELCAKVDEEFCERFKVGSVSAKDTGDNSSGPAPTHPLHNHLASVTAIGQKQ